MSVTNVTCNIGDKEIKFELFQQLLKNQNEPNEVQIKLF